MKLSALQILILPTSILALPIPVLVPESTSFLREQHAKSITDFAISNAFVQAGGAENFAEKLREYIDEHTDCGNFLFLPSPFKNFTPTTQTSC